MVWVYPCAEAPAARLGDLFGDQRPQLPAARVRLSAARDCFERSRATHGSLRNFGFTGTIGSSGPRGANAWSARAAVARCCAAFRLADIAASLYSLEYSVSLYL